MGIMLNARRLFYIDVLPVMVALLQGRLSVELAGLLSI